MRTSNCVKSLLSVAVLSLASLAASAQAGLVQINDAGGGLISGFSPLGNVLYAESFSPAAPVLQGIQFIDDHTLSDPNITASQFYLYYAPNTVGGSYTSGPGTDTAALVAITNRLFYASPDGNPPGSTTPAGVHGNGAGQVSSTILLNNLLPNTTYQLDALVGGVDTRPNQITIDGTFTNGGTPANSTHEFDNVVTFRTGPSETQATLVIAGTSDQPGPIISGLVVSTAPVPEPSSLVLAGAGALGLIFVARQRRDRVSH